LIEGKFDLARDQLATIEKICGSKDCEYYGELAKALTDAESPLGPRSKPVARTEEAAAPCGVWAPARALAE
jgi:hypothetical protein